MDPSPPHFISKTLVFSLALYNMIFLVGLKLIRTQMTTDNQSAFEIKGNAMFLIIAVFMLLVFEVASVLLFWTTILSKYYSALKFIGNFSGWLAPWSLLLVMSDHAKHELVLFLLISAIMGIAVAYMYSGADEVDKTLNKRSLISLLTHLGLIFVPVTLVLVLSVPTSLNWMVYPIIYSSAGMLAICFCIIFFKIMCINHNHNVHGIQQDKNTSNLKVQQEVKNMKDLEANKRIILE